MAELVTASTQPMEVGRALDVLVHGDMVEVHGLLPWSSNYTLLATIRLEDTSVLAVYKPSRGERPLWDFPRGSLAKREVAAYTVCQALGWNFIPPTVLRDGLYGPGAVQQFIETDFEAHYFTLRDQHNLMFQRVAAFDIIVNNADRKAGHCLLDRAGNVWLIDHGLTFHPDHKLRTVIWDFADQPLPDSILADLRRLRAELDLASTSWLVCLGRLVSRAEIEAFQRRLNQLIRAGHFPSPGPGRNVPYPLV